MFKKIATIFVLFFFLSAGFPAFAFESSSASFEIHAGDVESTVGASGPSANFKLQSGGGQTATGIDGPSSPTGFKVFSGILHWLAGIFSARYNQSAYRWFAKADSKDPGAALAAQNTPITAPTQLTEFRLRMLLHVYNRQLSQSVANLKLQFSVKAGSCDVLFSGENYIDVTTGTDIRYFNNATPADATSITTNPGDLTHNSDTIVTQTYEESNNFSNTAAAIPSGQDGEWDFSLVDFSAPGGTTYCFRVVRSDGSALDSYTAGAFPEIITTAGGNIPASGTYESPIFDSMQGGETSGIKSGFNTITWIETVPSNTNVRFQVASSDCSNAGTDPPTCTAGTWNYLGPNGSSGTYYESSATNYCSGSGTILCRISADHNNKRYFRYKIQLCGENSAVCTVSANGYTTPKVEKVILNWSP